MAAPQKSNGTYPVSYGLGVIVGLGLRMALHPVLPQFSAVGSRLLIGMRLLTLFPGNRSGVMGACLRRCPMAFLFCPVWDD